MKPTTLATIWGARLAGSVAEFRVWAPLARQVLLRFEDGRLAAMHRDDDGSYSARATARAGDRYFYQVDEYRPVPDPVSRLLPEGVHGPTEIVDPAAFRWSDADWRGLELREYILYELHTGAFTPAGTFDGIIERLDYLKRLGITVIELMPVAAFPGRRNWGYDGVSLYAVHASYGGPDGLKRLVDRAHGMGIAVMLDVVYNHLGAEGNYLRLFGPYFTSHHQTPWGEAINYDGAGREGVRRYLVENALYWIHEYHLDGLRLDAVQTIRDDSRYHIVEEIRDRVQQLAGELGRRVCVIAETDENDPRYVLPKARSDYSPQQAKSGLAGGPGYSPQQAKSGLAGGPGYALDAVWSDDFHHALHAVLTGEAHSYYGDFGRKEQIVRALNEGFAFQGEYFKFWGAPRGASPAGVPLEAHVICTQNHDQVGNRARGERLRHLVPCGARKLAAALLLLAPHTPLLFMGEEYGEIAPFQFFTDYGDPALQEAVRQGRRREFPHFAASEIPDPQDEETFNRSRLHWSLASCPTAAAPGAGVTVRDSAGNSMLTWYRELIALRKRYVTAGERTCHAGLIGGNIVMQVPRDGPRLAVIAGFPDRTCDPPPPDGATLLLASDEDGYRVRVFTTG